MRVRENRTIIMDIPADIDDFRDEKELLELFEYIYSKSPLHKKLQFPNTFKAHLECGRNAYKFTLTFDEDDEKCSQYRAFLNDLYNDYMKIESDYLKFKQFGDIECHALIRVPRIILNKE